MSSKGLPFVENNCSTAKSYLLGSTRISLKKNQADYNSIVAGLTLFFGVLLDYSEQFCLADKVKEVQGRIIKSTAVFSYHDVDLQHFMEYLDNIGDCLLKHISDPNGFKGHGFLTEVTTVTVVPLYSCFRAACIGLITCIIQASAETARKIAAIRQISHFLKKLDVCRTDLQSDMIADFLVFEEQLNRVTGIRASFIDYQRDVFDMKNILLEHLENFHLDPFVPRHGPGASASTSVRCWLDKHKQACSDARVGYLLGHASLGRQSDYLPLIRDEQSTRTSRYICVPKTWKKLRGISAEPVELMYFQQAILFAIDRMFTTDRWWASRINLHSQEQSRTMALEGSISGCYSTVDLSAASDSVTLQLVRDLFGNTELARWLLGTRSTHTLCGDSIVKLAKFAPMGSACCFPVECIVFALAAEVAVRRTCKTSSNELRQSRIFGDDIIVPTYATSELLEILSHLGFSVNSEKSYWVGEFREACGAECWAGHDIAPCRFRSLHSGLRGQHTDYSEFASMVALANFLFERGLHDTRAYLLAALFKKRVKLEKNRSVSCQRGIFTSFSGECSTLTTPMPTNFQVDWKLDRGLQTSVCKSLLWRERPMSRRVPAEITANLDVCEYIEWQIRHQDGVADFDKLWSNGWIESTASSSFSRLPLGTTMVPTLRWRLPPSYDTLGRSLIT